MPATWDDTTDRQLLLIIIHLTAPALPKWDMVAESMGEGFTGEAVRQRFVKLRKKAEETLGGVQLKSKKGGGRKAKVEGETKTAIARSKAKRKMISEEEVEEPDDDEANAKPAAKMIKTEMEDGSGAENVI